MQRRTASGHVRDRDLTLSSSLRYVFFPRWFLWAIALGGVAGCELVLGELPPAKKHHDAGTGGVAGSGGSGIAGSGGVSSGSGGSGVGGSQTATGGSTGSSSSTTHTLSQTGGGGGCCDCDGDGFDAKGACGGTDCDDHSKQAKPGQTAYFGVANPDPVVGFDWDCNGVAEQDPMLKVLVNCQPIGLPCAPGTGFLGTALPACGQSMAWGTCNQNGLGCVLAPIENKVMTCK